MGIDHSLRPYYDHDTFNPGYLVIFKPGVGLIDTTTNKPISASLGQALGQSIAGKGVGISSAPAASNGSRFMTSSSDKSYIYDLELLEYFDLNNLSELLKNLFWNFFKNYCRVLLAQPLEVVRLALQVGSFDFNDALQKKDSKKPTSRLMANVEVSTDSVIDDSRHVSSDEESDEIDYFQLRESSAAPKQKSPSRHPHKDNKIHPISKHTIDIMTAIASKDGPFALFRGLNASFIYTTLSHTTEAWITGFLSPFMGIPDPFFLSLTHLTDPAKSLWLSVLACVLAGVILMPLDLIKVRLMLTQFVKGRPDSPLPSPSASASSNDVSSTNDSNLSSSTSKINIRSVRDSIRHYPIQYLLHPPSGITLLTVLHRFSTSIFRKSAPYLLFIRYNVDAYLSPALYTAVNLLLLITELFIKLPVENLLRKEQMRLLLKPKSAEEDRYRVITIDDPDKNLIVNFNAVQIGPSDTSLTFFQRVGQLGLFNGWRVGVLNVIGFWGYNIFKSSDSVAEEKL